MFNHEEIEGVSIALGAPVVVALIIAYLKFTGSAVLNSLATKQEMIDAHNKLEQEISALKLQIQIEKVNQVRECSECKISHNELKYSRKFTDK